MRQWLWKALCEVVLHKTYSNLYLKEHLNELDPKKRALATRIYYGTLQNYALCEASWKRFAKRKVPSRVAVLLTMSVYQLMFVDSIPDYAIINEAVALAKKLSPKTGGFVNAVLRNVLRTPMDYPSDPKEKLAMETSLPEWLIDLWTKSYGWQNTEQIAKASLCVPPMTIRPNPLRISREELEKEEHLSPSPMDGLYLYSGSLAQDPLYQEGKISVQDAGSVEIARFTQAKPGDFVLDLCAAPGTKSMAMAEMMNNEGSITCLDLHKHRAALIEQDAKRLGLDIISARQADSTKIKDTDKYDVVLCDVPCSGWGVLGRKPDMKLHLDQKEGYKLAATQSDLLEAGARALKPGGTLVYSTCTLDPVENEEQVKAFCRAHPEFDLEKEQTLLPDGSRDGFFMARLIKGRKE